MHAVNETNSYTELLAKDERAGWAKCGREAAFANFNTWPTAAVNYVREYLPAHNPLSRLIHRRDLQETDFVILRPVGIAHS